MGDALETYIQDAFANTLGERNPQIRTQKVSDTFSYFIKTPTIQHNY